MVNGLYLDHLYLSRKYHPYGIQLDGIFFSTVNIFACTVMCWRGYAFLRAAEARAAHAAGVIPANGTKPANLAA
jgi:hypothetical protein